MRKPLLVVLLMLGASALPACALHTATSGRVVVTDARSTSVDVRFTDRDRALIQQYYARDPKKAPPGPARRESLPPGVARHDRLPPGLQARGLPGELAARLSPLPAGYVRLVVGGDVVLMNRNTRVLADILRGVAD